MATREKTLTVLCIDSGGVKGIIPAVMLEYLEGQLKVIDRNEDAKLADYFDLIAGSGTGGLIAAMVTAPGPVRGEALFPASKITPLFKDKFPQILRPQPRPCCWESKGVPVFYQGEDPKKVVGEIFSSKPQLNETLTDILITTYETEKLRPVYFSKESAKTKKYLDAPISDIITGGMAAYPWLKAYNFNNDFEFNVVDGSVAAPNPALIALTELIKKEKNAGRHLGFNRVIMISLGTCGASPTAGAGWTSQCINNMEQKEVVNASRTMLGEFTAVVNAYAVDYQVETFFKAYGSSSNYLRIYDDSLHKDMNEMDTATPGNLTKLEAYARDLLNKPVTATGGNPIKVRVNAGSGETYADALTRFAKLLSEEKRARSNA